MPRDEDETLGGLTGAEEDRPLQRDADGIWWTSLAPPPGFQGKEEGAWGERYYCRTLSEEERAVMAAEDEEDRAESRRVRDVYFPGEDDFEADVV